MDLQLRGNADIHYQSSKHPEIARFGAGNSSKLANPEEEQARDNLPLSLIGEFR